MTSSNMLANSAVVVAEARKRGVKIIHVPISFAPGFKELSNSSYGKIQCDRIPVHTAFDKYCKYVNSKVKY